MSFSERDSPGTASFLFLKLAEPGLHENVFILLPTGVVFKDVFDSPITCPGLVRAYFAFLGELL
jgi:hypothetical protein